MACVIHLCFRKEAGFSFTPVASREVLLVERRQAVVFTSEPEERFVRKLSSAVCAALMLPELRAEPICDSIEENEFVPEEELVLFELPVEELPLESRRLVSES